MKDNLFEVPEFGEKESRLYNAITMEFGVTNDDAQKNFVTMAFEDYDQSMDGEIVQSKLLKKAFFEDSHSLVYTRAVLAQEKGTMLNKVRLTRYAIKSVPYFILGTDGKPRKDMDGNPIIANTIVVVCMPDENPTTMYRAQLKRLRREKRLVEFEEDHFESEETDEALAPKDRPIPEVRRPVK